MRCWCWPHRRILIACAPARQGSVRAGCSGELSDGGRFGAAGPGDVLIGTSFEWNGSTLRSSPSDGTTVLERWDIASSKPLGRDEALRHYFATLAGSDGLEVDLRSARPIEPPDILELLPASARIRHVISPTFALPAAGVLLDASIDAATGMIRSAVDHAARAGCGAAQTPRRCRRGGASGRGAVNVADAAFWKHWVALSAAEDRRRKTMRAGPRRFDERALRGGLEEATNLFERNRLSTEPGDDPIVAAARIVAQADKIKIVAPRESHSESQAAVQAIAIESRLDSPRRAAERLA